MKVCIGGTFNVFHKGHKYLFNKAFEIAGETGKVYIGVTKGQMLKQKKYVNEYTKRVQAIKQFLDKHHYTNRAEIVPIYDKYGLAVDGEYDAIIASPETEENAEEINKNRLKKNKKPLQIIKLPHILAEDNKPISSTRIIEKKITIEGKIIKDSQ